MLPFAPLVLALFSFPLSTIAVVSPNKTCGLTLAGSNNGYTCPGDAACCSQFGYCGTGDTFCLSSYGCQARYSNSTTASCYAPRNATTASVDGTCGLVGIGKNGYRCPPSGATCCSQAGYCGNTTDHCAASSGCQSAYGSCTATGKKNKRSQKGRRSAKLWEDRETKQDGTLE
ncbi:carbohydrate-binding module family 18 protein [Podospora australis]|uniref:Carbohydrate-binding module family 18 protein n=1 Tax=Podospora australis TaxID=1536484 RepID=A0AAN6WMM8_9PEZI|nr:carbohydrate-binding module family 18 protein [Podospora australis]